MRSAAVLIEADEALSTLLAVVRERMVGDAAHDLAHLMRVADWTLRLLPDALAEGGIREPSSALRRVAVAAALLHDVVNVPKSDPRRADASRLSADVARSVLPAQGFTAEEVEVVADAIRDHSYSGGAVPRSPVGRALQDADRLEALGALGIMRCVATAARGGGAFFDPDDPWARVRPLDDGRFAVDHFQTKLLRLPPTLLTAAGRAEAERRASLMIVFLQRLGIEIGAAYDGIGAT